MTTAAFIQANLNADVRKLALSKAPDGVDLRFAIQQIDGRQRAKTKLPKLAANPEIIFPVHLSVEQCSSEATAEYKREVLQRRLGGETAENSGCPQPLRSQPLRSQPLRCGSLLIDLTGGFGIDFLTLAPLFSNAIYVERNEELCEIARQNFRTLGLTNAEIINTEVNPESATKLCAPRFCRGGSVLFFLDPARRSTSGARTFAISDCTPDVIALMTTLKAHGDTLFLKLSPMLDWHKAVEDIEACGVKVEEVHIVSVKNECKELLLLVALTGGRAAGNTRLFCKNDDCVVEIAPLNSPLREGFSADKGNFPISPRSGGLRGASAYLLLPNASLMKAGCWDFICQRYGVTQADRNSHLFFAERKTADFPGKQYEIQAVTSLNKKELRQALQGITQANIAVRNFPMTAEALRKRLKLKDGGSVYIFGTTITGETRLIIARS